MAGLSLSRLLDEFPDVTLRKIEFLGNSGARKAGIRSIPTLVSVDKKLSGIFLTKKKMRKFLESL